MITKKRFPAVLLVPTCLLTIPLVANFTVDGFNWSPGDFVFLWVAMVAIGLAYRFVTSKAGGVAHRLAAGIALAAGFMIFWGNLAVGFIGGEDNPANLMYGGVLAIGAIGAVVARGAPGGMARAMFATAFALVWVPVIALLVRPHDFSPGVPQVFGLNAMFVLLFVASGILFRSADNKRDRAAGRLSAM